MRIVSICEIIIKALKNDRSDIFHTELENN